MKRQNIVFLTGAGISVESGLSTFRGKNGMWNDEGLQMRASAGFFYENPAESLEFYNWRRNLLAGVKPNHAHKMLAWLEKYHDVTVITQNVDNLHELAGSTNIVHLHGELSKVCSSANPNDPQCIKEYPLDVPIRIGDLAADGSQLRPFVVMFDEYVPNMEVASDIVSTADAFIVIGSSLKVYPAAILIEQANPEAIKVLIDPTEQDKCKEFGFVQIQETASVGVRHLLTEYLGIENIPERLLTVPELDVLKSANNTENWFSRLKQWINSLVPF